MSLLKLELPAPATGRLPALDELKGLAIILVILYHAGGVLAWNNTLHGDLGVDIFVILSGIGLALGSVYPGTRLFLIRRFLRIFPTYWIVLTAFWLLNAHFLGQDLTTKNLVLHYLGIHGWCGDGYAMAINDSFWFITLILSLYLLYSALQKLMPSPGRLLLAGAAISLTITLILFYQGQSGSFSHMALRLPGFFVGLLIGRLLKTGRLDLVLTAPLALALFLLTYVPYTQGVMFHSVLVGLALMATYLFAWKTLVPAALEKPVARGLKFLGDRSLTIFLIHQPLIRHYNYYVQRRWFDTPAPSPNSVIVGMVIALAVTILISVELDALLQKIPGLNRRAA